MQNKLLLFLGVSGAATAMALVFGPLYHFILMVVHLFYHCVASKYLFNFLDDV